MGIPARKVKRHLEPEGFNALDRSTLEQYAEALLVSVAELKQVPQ